MRRLFSAEAVEFVSQGSSNLYRLGDTSGIEVEAVTHTGDPFDVDVSAGLAGAMISGTDCQPSTYIQLVKN